LIRTALQQRAVKPPLREDGAGIVYQQVQMLETFANRLRQSGDR
jgi:hypothetical protein